MVLLVAEKDMVQERTVRWKERAGHLDRLCVPLFRLKRLLFDIKRLEAADLFFELNDESNLRADAEVTDA